MNWDGGAHEAPRTITEHALLLIHVLWRGVMGRVMIVEDVFLIAAGLAHLVADMGHEVCGMAMSADRAMTLALSLLPDLALVDGRLARGSSGLEVVLALIKAGIPSILISADISSDEAAGAGAFAHAQKPINIPALTSLINKALRRGAHRKAQSI